MMERLDTSTIDTGTFRGSSGWGSRAINQRRVHIGLPMMSAPRASATIAIGIGLAACGQISTNSVGYQTLQLSEIKSNVIAAVAPDRRRRYASAAQALSEIRLWAGLAWGTIADMLQVSRRTVHQWANGVEPAGKRADALWDLHALAEEKSVHGQSAAMMLLTSRYRVEAKPLRASPKRSAVNPGAILTADNSALEHVPTSRGIRNIRRSKSA